MGTHSVYTIYFKDFSLHNNIFTLLLQRLIHIFNIFKHFFLPLLDKTDLISILLIS
jgi:hypothetical protein